MARQGSRHQAFSSLVAGEKALAPCVLPDYTYVIQCREWGMEYIFHIIEYIAGDNTMADSTKKENSNKKPSHDEEPQFEELSNKELDEVQGAGGVYYKITPTTLPPTENTSEALRSSDVDTKSVRTPSKS